MTSSSSSNAKSGWTVGAVVAASVAVAAAAAVAAALVFASRRRRKHESTSSSTARATAASSAPIHPPPPPRRDLFGGAISVHLPHRFEDVSQFRQVPDNQEVLADAATDQSVIIEILEYRWATHDQADAALRFFYDDLCGDNTAAEAKTLTVPTCVGRKDMMGTLDTGGVKYDASAAWMVTEQQVSKFKETAANTVRIYMLNIRLPLLDTDILVTLNAPVRFADASSSHGRTVTPEQDISQLFRHIVTSFAIHDWQLFQQQ